MEGIKQKMETKLDSVKRKTTAFGKVFGDGFKKGMKSEWSSSLAIGSGLWQGLKYKGSVKKGIATTAVVKVFLATADGMQSVINNWNVIKNA